MAVIQYIPNKAIDKTKWDNCIEQSSNGLIYAYSWYLDTMSKHWDALVLGDYETVMPLTWNKKYGIYYLYQPWFCASLGIFSKKKINTATVESFLKAVPDKFRYWDIYLNQYNLFSIDEFPLTKRMNYVLSLSQTYETIAALYRTNLKRNIKKAEATGLQIKQNTPLKSILELAKETMQRIAPINDEEINLFSKLYKKAKQQQEAETLGIYLKDELVASAVFFYSHKRWYYILVGNHPNGKTIGASHYLIDRFIHAHAGEDAVLDFEGSDIRNLAFFYSSYGATEEIYPAIRMNKLPKLLKWLKD
ncbi:MAG: GNAT family N-acetyltransferase [Chitinophagaceae bacterium]|nr:GNAT family N-acetyltransferase [Chitinophagaceae bacterium]